MMREQGDLDRRGLLKVAAAGAVAVASSRAIGKTPEDISWKSAWELRSMMVDGRISSVVVAQHFLDRIAKLDPTLHLFRFVDRDGVLAQARACDVALQAGRKPGLLHGVPIAVKESLNVKGVPLHGTGTPIADFDDIMIERLRAAGAIIIGTTVMPGMGRLSWQTLAYGVPPTTELETHARNPWKTTNVPGSSSAGSAGAVAAGLVPLAVGGDGGGSTRLPSALSGVIGVHPARGRIPSVDYTERGFELTNTHGPIARDARDAALVMQATAGPDGRDFVSIQDNLDFLTKLDSGVDGFSFAWTPDFGLGEIYGAWRMPAVVETVRRAAQGFGSLGAAVKPIDDRWEDFWDSYVVTSRFYLSGTQSRMDQTKPDEKAIRNALATRRNNAAKFEEVFRRHTLLLSPTLDFTAPTVEAWDAVWNKDDAKYTHGTFAPTYTTNTMMLNWLGYPATSVPCGFVNGLPVGLQIVAPPSREALVLQAAQAFLKAFPRTERPKMAI